MNGKCGTCGLKNPMDPEREEFDRAYADIQARHNKMMSDRLFKQLGAQNELKRLQAQTQPPMPVQEPAPNASVHAVQLLDVLSQETITLGVPQQEETEHEAVPSPARKSHSCNADREKSSPGNGCNRNAGRKTSNR